MSHTANGKPYKMDMKSLNSILSEMDERAGVGNDNTSPEKIIKCSSCGTSYRVPGYTIDYVCQCKKKSTELDASKLTVNMANMQRDYIIKTEARDRIIPAIARPPETTSNRRNVV